MDTRLVMPPTFGTGPRAVAHFCRIERTIGAIIAENVLYQKGRPTLPNALSQDDKRSKTTTRRDVGKDTQQVSCSYQLVAMNKMHHHDSINSNHQ